MTEPNPHEQRSDFEFVLLCTILIAAIFGLIQLLTYFTNSSDAAAIAARSTTTGANYKGPIAFP
jgi:Flp pilus assembly protein TadG